MLQRKVQWPFVVRRVVGHSMIPTLLPNQVVIVRRRRPRIGEVAMFYLGGKEYIKRLQAGTDEAGFTFAGDNPADSFDCSNVPAQAIVGVVIWPTNTQKTPGQGDALS